MYASEEDFLTRFAGCTAEAGDEAISLALADATNLIDTYLCKRYELPFAEVPSILKKLCVDLASYMFATADELVTEDIRQRYEDAINTLKDIARGTVDLPIKKTNDGTGSTGESESGAVLIVGEPRVFHRKIGY